MEIVETERCEFCGSPIRTDQNGLPTEEVGEFWSRETGISIYGHAQCGIDAEMEIA